MRTLEFPSVLNNFKSAVVEPLRPAIFMHVSAQNTNCDVAVYALLNSDWRDGGVQQRANAAVQRRAKSVVTRRSKFQEARAAGTATEKPRDAL